MTTVYVLNMQEEPLMPTTRCDHVRRLLKSKKARVVSKKPFTIQLLYKVENVVQDLYFGIDPGRTNVGVAVVREDGKCVYSAQVETRNKEVPKLMAARAEHRRKHRKNGRRDVRLRRAKAAGTRKPDFDRILPGCEEPITCKGIKNKEARFLNRRRPEGWLTPTATHLLRTHLNVVAKIAKILPVTHVVMELNKFAFMAMDNPDIKRVDYQKGQLYGLGSVENAVREQQGGHCIFCERKIAHNHHIIPRSKGGSNTLPNIAGLCDKHHDLVHKDEKWAARLASKKEGMNKKYGALSVLNQIIPYLNDALVQAYPGHAYVTHGYNTKAFRDRYAIPKDHYLDAYCIACSILKPKCIQYPDDVFTIRQFRRHDRQVCHKEMVNRKYTLDGKVVAVNRHKAIEQTADSLEEYVVKGGNTAKLQVLKHQPQLKNPKRWLPGCLVYAGNKPGIMIGTSGTQATKGGKRRPSYCDFTDGRKERFSQCRFALHNAGLVYV